MPTEISGSTGVNKIQDGTVVNADIASNAAIVASKMAGAVLLTGTSSGDGGSASGSGADMMTISNINLSNYQGKHLIVFASTAIQEAQNSSNVEIIRIQLSNGSDSPITLAAARQGVSHTNVDVGTNFLVHLSTFAVYEIPSAYATTCSLRINGGIDSNTFYYGNAPNYSSFDGEGAGIRMTYLVV